jgi:hypothetical protein
METFSAAAASNGVANSTVVTVLLAVLGSSAIAAILTAALAGLRAGATIRRDGYAASVATLVAWAEYPYRIRRRTSDSPETLSQLAQLGHDLQERVARQRAWIAAENGVLSKVFEGCLTALRGPVGLSCRQAWEEPHLTVARQMNLGAFGPGDLAPQLRKLECAVAYRFGIRRLLFSPLLRRRLESRGCL